MTQLELYKEALRILKDSEIPSAWPSFRAEIHNYGIFYFSGLCELLDRINYENGRDMDAYDMLFKSQSEDILGRELDEFTFWFTKIKTNAHLAKQERIEHLEKLIDYYESKGW